MRYDDAPEWLKAANAHAIAKDDTSIFEDVIEGVTNAPSFLAVSIASAGNSFYNTGVAVGNIFMPEVDEFEYSDTGELISSYDDDLGKYYQENKTAADLVGFIGGSFIPGMGAVKGLNAAQKALQVAARGEVGGTMAAATKILAPAMDTYVKREAATLAARSQTFSFMHQNSLKALAAGTQQGVLESLAFEVGVAATMFKSPVLEDMDVGDIIKNGLMGVGIGGVFSGVISGAQTYFGVQRLVKQADLRQSFFNRSTQLSESTRHVASDKMMAAALDAQTLERLEPTAEFVTAQKLAQGETGESLLPHHIAAEVEKLKRVKESNLQRFNNTVREEATKLAKGDSVLAGQMIDITQKLGPDGVTRVFFNVDEVVRAGDQTSFEKLLKAKVNAGEFKNLDEARRAMSTDSVTTHIRLHSGAFGEEVAGKIGAHRLADDFSREQLEKLIAKTPFKPSKDHWDFRKKLDPREAQLRYIAARNNPQIAYGKMEVGAHDLPVLEAAWRNGAEELVIRLDGGAPRKLTSNAEIKEYLTLAKGEAILAHRELGTRSDVMELVLDVRKDFLEGTAKSNAGDDALFAQASYAREASEFLGRELKENDLAMMPSFAKMVYKNDSITDEDGMIMKGMELLKHREKLAKQSTDTYFASFAGEFSRLFPEISEDLLRTLWRGEGGAGFISNAGGAYGSMASMASYIGDLTAEMKRTRINALTDDISGTAQHLLANPDEAVRFSTVNALISNTPEKYVLNEAGDALIPYKIKRWLDEGGEGDYPTLAAGSLEEIPLETPYLRAMVLKHIEIDEKQTLAAAGLHNLEGNAHEFISNSFRPIRPDPRTYKHVAFVKDESLVGVGHTRMIFAKDGAELEDMIAKVRAASPSYKVYTRQESEAFYRARGEWEYDKTLHENYIDNDLLSRGISSNFLPPTDPQIIVNQLLQHHVRRENTNITQAILKKYEKETNEIKRLAEQWNLTNGSRVGYPTVTEMLTSNQKNPYSGMLKSMLNITKVDEHSLWMTPQQGLDYHVSNAWNKATEAFFSPKLTTPDRLERVNGIFEELGFKSAYYDAATTLLANSKIPQGVLSSFVRKANAFLTTTVLRLDVFNSITNTVGASVLYSAELNNVLRGIKSGSPEAVGELSRLANVRVPGTGGDEIFSPMKLMSESLRRFHDPELRKTLLEQYKARGMMPDMSDQYFKSLDPLTLTGAETVQDMTKKINQIEKTAEEWAKVGEKWTGNKFGEQFGRWLATDTMKQITEIAVKHGLMDEKAAWMYVGTFNKRVNGVIRAAERPLMFQGPIGQAMGLFQSYQMNLLQQVFRNIGEGNKKSLALMAGMQASVFGASSLPGFNLINSTLVGNASGNPEHYDLFSATRAIFGQEGADWLMYGVPSNILNASLYTRGDTNPRTWHVVPNPTNPSEIPFISAFGKALGSIKGAVGQAQDGATLWQSFLSGVEHLGISRPLAGLAQVARGMTSEDNIVTATSRDGSLTGANDLYSLASLVRIAGAKPIDESIVTNGYFRINAYAEKDRESREKLGAAVKRRLASGEEIEDSEVEAFAEAYVGKGGSQKGFGQWWMNQYKNATRTQSEQLARKLESPYARRMEEVMGGRESLFDIGSF